VVVAVSLATARIAFPLDSARLLVGTRIDGGGSSSCGQESNCVLRAKSSSRASLIERDATDSDVSIPARRAVPTLRRVAR